MTLVETQSELFITSEAQIRRYWWWGIDLKLHKFTDNLFGCSKNITMATTTGNRRPKTSIVNNKIYILIMIIKLNSLVLKLLNSKVILIMDFS